MRLALIYYAVALSLAVSALASDLSNSNSTEIADEAIEVFHSGGDPLGDDGLTRRSTKHKSKKQSRKGKYVTSKPDKGAKLMTGKGKVTWYASQDLKNPQCGNGKWNPNNNCHIGAVMYGWNGGPKCGQFVQICNPRKKACIKVRIVDKCAGCKQNHIDLTKSAFRQLSPSGTLDEGVVSNLDVYYDSRPNPWDFDLFGPVKLKG